MIGLILAAEEAFFVKTFGSKAKEPPKDEDDHTDLVVVPDAADVDRCLAELADAREGGALVLYSSDRTDRTLSRYVLTLILRSARRWASFRASFSQHASCHVSWPSVS